MHVGEDDDRLDDDYHDVDDDDDADDDDRDDDDADDALQRLRPHSCTIPCYWSGSMICFRWLDLAFRE